jgi:D-3-phosphoglycerate dehydrogenase / 2-oxoglutarate reductase
MRLLIADKLHAKAIEELRTLPVEVIYEPELTKETLENKLSGVGILVVRSTEVTREAIEKAKELNLIVRAGAEHHTIDVRAASQHGIYVANCPGRNASAVAELVFGMLVALDRRIPDAVQSLRQGRWERAEYSKAIGLHGRTIGIAGFGAIGREVWSRARAFGLNPLVWSRSLSASKAAEQGVMCVSSLDELASRSDIFTVHLRLTERTKGIISRRVLEMLPKRALFLNLARADLLDYAALQDVVETRGLRAAVDVYPDEPKGKREYTGFLANPSAPSSSSGEGGFIYGTPHIAASTDQAQLAIATETVRVIRSFLLAGSVPNVVNVIATPVAKFQLVIRMADRVGTFANALNVLKRHGINVEEISNTIFEGGAAACAKLRLLSRPSEQCLQEIRAFEEVLHVDVVTLPNLA